MDNLTTISSKAEAGQKQRSVLSLLFRKELMENRKTLLTELTVAWGACILLGSFLGLFGLGGGEGELTVFMAFIQLIACVYASFAFSSMKHKRGRIATLMLPASAKEKFFMKWTLTVPVLFLVMIAGIYLGDIFRVIVGWLAESQKGDKYYHIINIFSFMNGKNACISFGAITSYFFGQAVYLFGAILWPRLSFLKTFAVVYCLEMIIGMGALFTIKFWLQDPPLTSAVVENAIWIICSLQIPLTLLLYWLTYHRFKNSSVIYRLF